MAESLDLYEQDFYAWTQDQAARLRALRPNGIDVENLAEEIETLGRSERRAVTSLMRQIVHHLLKLEMLPWGSARDHWQAEVRVFRDDLETEFRDSPSLRARRGELYPEAWSRARRDFLRDLHPDEAALVRTLEKRLPVDAPPRYDLDTQVVASDWFPPRPV